MRGDVFGYEGYVFYLSSESGEGSGNKCGWGCGNEIKEEV
jgi:hypothetical protein